MKLPTLILMLVITTLVQAQMPRDDDYSNWNWEDQSQNNWQRKLEAGEADPEGDGDSWTNIKPPFAVGTSRIGDIVEVYTAKDYTKAKGWYLIWAQFNGIYPYFILYNKYLSLVRTFFYLDNILPFGELMATLSFHRSTDNPAILNSNQNALWATDKYLDDSQTGASDVMAVMIRGVALRTWCSADFPILLDNNIKNSKYNSRKWVFKFYGVNNYDIRIKGSSTTPPGANEQHSISGSNLGTGIINDLASRQAQFHKQLKTTTGFLNEMKNSANNVNSNSPKFLQKYKSKIQGIGSIAQTFEAAVGVSSGVGAVLGFVNLISGTFSTGVAPNLTLKSTIEYIDLEGSMRVEQLLGGNTLKVMGVNGSKFPPVSWDPYDCVPGYFNMTKTPTMRVVKPYRRYARPEGKYNAVLTNADITRYSLTPAYVSGYPGQYKKYKLEDDLEVVWNNPLNAGEFDLIDIHFAIICRPTGTGNRLYSVASPNIARYQHYVGDGGWSYSTRQLDVPNPVYRDLEKGRFVIHKWNQDPSKVIFGTPYIKMNQFKGIIFEVPEDTDVKIRVIAKFKSTSSAKPIIFQNDYNFDVSEEYSHQDPYPLFPDEEVSNFRYSDYYQDPKTYLSLGPGNYTGTYKAMTIELVPGFTGHPNFLAEGLENNLPTRGNTVVRKLNYNCSSSSARKLSRKTVDYPDKKLVARADEIIELKPNPFEAGIKVYPNPSSGRFRVKSALKQPIEQVQVFSFNGTLVYERQVQAKKLSFDLSDQAKGIYILNLIYNHTTTIRKIIKQ